uniref:Uncharacterized protein n=1 Tax=Guillardia theta (strain CCMP2712) TaxID=905079 RepID=A0A0C3TC24_GUITC
MSCLRWPSYGSPDARKPEFCAGHAPAGSVNKKKKKCCVDGCRSTGTFGSLDDYRMYCVQHKDITHRDLRSRKCNEEGCDKQPSYQSFKG